MTPRKSPPRPRGRAIRGGILERPGLLLLLVALLAAVPYLNALGTDFSQDDFSIVRSNPMIAGDESALGLLTWVDRPDLYRPLTMLTYAANGRAGRTALGYHLVNVVLHVAVTALVFRLALVLFQSPLAATATAALFAVHPVHTEAVTSVVGRAELLAALLTLAALLAIARAARDPSPRRRLWWAVSVLAYALAVLAKESAFTAFVLCALVHWWRSPERRVRPSLAAAIPYVLVALAYVGWRLHVVGSLTMAGRPELVENPLAHAGTLPRLATAAVVLGQYLWQLTVPLHLSSDYSFDQLPVVVSALDPRLALATAALVALAAGVWLALRRAPELALSAAFLFVPLGVTANVFFAIGTIRADRLLYLPSFGFCLAAGWLAARLARRRPREVLAALALVVVLFGARTWVRNDDWRDNGAVFAAAVRTAPGSARAHLNWGSELVLRRRFVEALEHLRISASILPSYATTRANLGSLLAIGGQMEDAIREASEAVRLAPDRAPFRASLARMFLAQGRLDEAIVQLSAAVELDPAALDTRYLLGAALLRRGRVDEAITELSAVVRASPARTDARRDLDAALAQRRRQSAP